MNPEELLNIAYEAIENRTPSEAGTWQLCWLNGRIQFIPVRSPCHPEIVFQCWTRNQVEHGLTAEQWHELSIKLLNFWREKKL